MKPFTKLAVVLLAIVAVLHLLRVILKLEMLVDEVVIPMWASILGFVIPAFLCYGLIKESKSES